MARKGDLNRWFNVAVVGLSGTEKEKGAVGIGKSCLCNRFMRSLADDYSVDHISVLSQTDFSGRVVNNDHFLYWGEVSKFSEDGIEMQFQVIEQTEFIDDASFQPFKGGKMEPYSKRCTATKLTSAEKLMYICKNQLGIEKEYEQKVLPDGKISIDGFICVFDVSIVPSRSVDKQVEVVTAILNNVMKTKKPVILVTTKNDDAHEAYVKEAEKLSQRKEYKGGVLLVETSAHENINVDLAFIALAQQIDRSKGRAKIVPFVEAARTRKELLDASTESFMSLIRSQVTDHRALWSQSSKKFAKHEDFVEFTRIFGIESTQRLFRRHVKKLKDEHLAKRVQGYMEMLPNILQEMVPEISTLRDGDWPTVQQHIKNHPDFNHYFYKCPEDIPWTELDWEEDGIKETRIPYDVLETGEAETVFRNHANSLQQEHKRLEWKKQFKQLLEDTGYVTPGKLLAEVRVLFMGHECFEALCEDDCHYMYEKHQKEIIDKAKHNFQELLLEHADLFYHFKSIAPTGTITQDDIKEITDALKEDSRYKALDRLDQDRKLMLFQHLGFVHCPIREHCPAFPNCIDALIERVLSNKAHRPSSWNHGNQWLLNSDSNQLNLVILGFKPLADELCIEIRAQCHDDEYEIDCHLYCLEYRVIHGDVSMPQNSFQAIDFLPHGCFCVYSNSENFEYIRDSLEKTLLSNLEQDDRLPFQGLPIVVLFVSDSLVEESEMARLREDGQSLADSLQCPFIDVTHGEFGEVRHSFSPKPVASALRQLVQSIRHRAGFISVYQSVVECSEPDIRIIMCMFCGDPYSVENVLGPLLNHQCCFLSGERSIILETFLGTSKRKVEVIISSFHGANAFREELVHGFILVYSTKRKASLATLNAFSMNIPNLPIQIMAVTDSGGANAFFSNDLSHQLMTEGNATADRLQAHFMTSTSNFQQKTAFYTPFFKEVWEKKPEIEQAFHMEDPGHGVGEDAHPLPPPRHESYLIQLGSNDGNELFEGDDDREQMSSGSDETDTYSLIDYNPDNEDPKLDNKSTAKLNQGWVDDSVYIQHTEHEEGVWGTNFSQHAFTTGRPRHTTKSKYKTTSHTMKQPGKLNMKDYSLVTDAIARMNLGSKDSIRVSKITKSTFGHAPLATPENVDLGSEYAQVKDVVGDHYMCYDGEYSYTLVQDALNATAKHKIRLRREKGRQMMSDSDSEWSSLERRQKTASSEAFPKVSRKPTTHKRARRKRTGIPVATPRVPQLSSNGPNPTLPPADNYRFKAQDNKSETLDKSKFKMEGLSLGVGHDEESNLEVSSPRDVNSPLFGVVPKLKDGNKTLRRKEKQRVKEEEKLEKRRLKEEKLKKLAEEREKKKQKTKNVGGVGKLTLEQLVQSESKAVPVILEKCVQFVENEGLDSEGIYRVPGNRAHVDLLFQKFDEDHNVDISSLDIPVNAVATALKDFFSKRLPPLFTEDLMGELEDLSAKGDRSCRLLALRSLLKKLPLVNFEVLKFIFHHFVRVSENCKLNSMDSKNLAICWWPTLLPIEFSDLARFEQMRPHLEDIVQTMIDQYPFLFCGKEAFVMV